MTLEGNQSSRDSWESVEDHDSDPDIASAKCLFMGSKHFSPVLSLGCKETPIPVPEAPRYHSMVEFDKCIPNLAVQGTPPPKFAVSQKLRKVVSRLTKTQKSEVSPSLPNAQTQSKLPLPSSSTTETLPVPNVNPLYPIPGRRFLQHQLPVPVPRLEKKKPNVLTLMDDCQGPLAALNQARLTFKRIRIWRRDPSGIRGYCTGFVIAFDKHWNIILKDVDEIYQRRREVKPIVEKSNDIQIQEKLSWKSGQLLSEYNQEMTERQDTTKVNPVVKNSQVVRKGTPTGYLINGPEDALEVCRIGMRSLLKQGINQEKAKEKPATPPSLSSSPVTKSTLRKKQLVILREAQVDFLGNKIVARSQLYEIVERHLPQVVLIGRSIAFVETNL